MKTIAQVAATALLLSSGAAFAQTQQGLVNVSVEGNSVQVPIGVAANVCDVDANVLATQFVGTDQTACEIDQETAAANNIGGSNAGGGQGNGGGNQNGLVNVSVDDNVVQVPVGIAANVCDVDANVIAQQFKGTDRTVCTIDQATAAANNINVPGGAADADQTGSTTSN
ncbi:MAG TPA: hypothetical protein VGN97_06320 [Mesorhizobium sp.]|jgi:hypothetical protein|nr:hypothetical protein [Mesorhizobium sp.]